MCIVKLSVSFINLVDIYPKSNKTLVEDSDNRLSVCCMTSENVTITQWYKDGTLLNINADNKFVEISTDYISMLDVKKITPSDSGRYHCEASNGQNSSLSGYFNIISKYEIFLLYFSKYYNLCVYIHMCINTYIYTYVCTFVYMKCMYV